MTASENSSSPEESVLSAVLQPEAYEAASDLSEWAVDEIARGIVDSEVLEAIPLVKSVIAMAKGVAGFRDYMFAKNLARCIAEVGQSSSRDRERWRERIQDHPADMGERVLVALDRANAPLKAVLIGRLFRLYLDRECESPEFMRSVEMVERALTDDLLILLDRSLKNPNPKIGLGAESPLLSRLTAVGLVRDLSPTARSLHWGNSIVRKGLSTEGDLLVRAYALRDDQAPESNP